MTAGSKKSENKFEKISKFNKVRMSVLERHTSFALEQVGLQIFGTISYVLYKNKTFEPTLMKSSFSAPM